MRDHETPVSIWKRLFVGAGVFVLLLILLAAGHYWLQRSRDADALRQALADLDETDPGWRLAEIEAARPSVADESNSALTVLSASRLMPKTALIHNSVQQLLSIRTPELFDAEQMDLLEKELTAVHAAVVEARILADKPTGRHPLNYPRIPVLGTMKQSQEATTAVIKLLRFDALHLAQKGMPKEALRSCRAIFHTARSFDDEPLSSSQVLRSSGVYFAALAVERTLALSEPALEDLTDLQQQAADEEPHPGLLLGRRGERAMAHVLVDGLIKGSIPVKALFDEENRQVGWRVKYADWTIRDMARRDYPQGIRVFNRAVEIAQLPLHEQAVHEKDLEDEIKRLSPTSFVLSRWKPVMSALAQGYREKVTQVRCLQVVLATERYRRDKGIWPAKLADLTPRLLKKVPLDPFDGKELRYKKLADGVIVYSVGPDLIDDGGFIRGVKRSGRALTRDVGLRL